MISLGTILKSTAKMDDPVFANTTILITEYNEKGAMGFVVNNVYPRVLNELVEFQSSPAFPLFNGGPVDHEHLYFIHNRPDLIDEGVLIINGIYWGGNFKQVIENINAYKLTEEGIKIFVGYCGWDTNELEAEIKDGFWEVSKDTSDIFG